MLTLKYYLDENPLNDAGVTPPEPDYTPPWRGYAHSLLCHTPGSNKERAEEIRTRLSEADSNAVWSVFVSDNDQSVSFFRATGERVWHDDTCGKRMYVWRRDKSLFTKKKCSNVEQSRMKTLMRAAAADGGGANAVRDRLFRTLGHNVHYLMVVHRTGNWALRYRHFASCLVNVASNGYQMYVYMNN